MKNFQNKQPFYVISIILLCSTTLFCCDYFNIFTKLGVNTTNFNYDFLNLLVNNTIIIIIFIITYFIINDKEKNKIKNQEKYAKLLLNECYKKCIDYISMLDQECIKNNIKAKGKFNSELYKIVSIFEKAPFSNNHIIVELATNGIINHSKFLAYSEIKSCYQSYIGTAILLFNQTELFLNQKEELINKLKLQIKN